MKKSCSQYPRQLAKKPNTMGLAYGEGVKNFCMCLQPPPTSS